MAASAVPLAPGVVLIAEPALRDPNFRRTVVLLCEHTDEGTFGLILNRPTGLALTDVVEGPIGFEAELMQGGPVQLDTLHFLHAYAELDGAMRVLDGVWWGGRFDAAAALVTETNASPEFFRFFAGYAGWGPGQLAEEVDGEGWIVRSGHERMVYGSDEHLWREILLALGGEYRLLANYPDDPSLN